MMLSQSLLAIDIAFRDIFPYPWLQIPGLILVIGLIVGWIMWRKRQL